MQSADMAQSEWFFDEPPVRENADVRLQPLTSFPRFARTPHSDEHTSAHRTRGRGATWCGRTFVYELISAGELETVKLGRLRRVPVAALDALVERLRARARDD